ncbi:MAG: cytochrome P450 [Ahniella sp.]|nr:cytochrome P450 [Ahniella sp.]
MDPFDDAFLADPYAYHDALRDSGPVVWLQAIGCFGMARYSEVQAALRDNQTYVSGRGVGLADFSRETPFRPPSLLLETDPPLHDRTRGLMNRIVTLGALRAVAPRWQAIADAMVEQLLDRGRFDAVSELGTAFPLAVFPDLIGLQDEGREQLIPYAAGVFNAFGPRNALFERSQIAAREASVWVAAACKRENLKPDGWGMQVYAAADRGDCSEEEAERLVRSFLSAGVDTTVNGIGNLLHAFALHPDQWQRLHAQPNLPPRAFEEGLRWIRLAVQTFFRTTSRSVETPEGTIPEGSKVALFLAAANRDPRRWENPERFDIGRRASGHVGFGFGIHQCLGQMVARQEVECLLRAMLPRVSAIRLTGTPERGLNNTLHSLATLPVEFEAVKAEVRQ